MKRNFQWLVLLLFSLLILAGCNSHEHTGGERCEAMAVCEICGEEYGEPAGHLYVYSSNRDAHTGICQREGCTAPNVVGPHGGAGNVCTAPGACALCGYEYLPQGQHDFRGATCAKLGTCVHCGEEGGDYSKHHSFPDNADHCALCGGEYYLSTLEFTLNQTQDAYILSNRGTCTRTVITVPATYRGLPVTQVGMGAFSEEEFQGDGRIVEVNLPASVTKIDSMAFQYCKELKTVSMPGVQVLGNAAFMQCVQLEQVNLPDSLLVIGSHAFNGCVALREVTIPTNVTELGERAFNGCESLLVVQLPNTVKAVGGYAFNGCTALRQLTIPSGIEYVGTTITAGCASLEYHIYEGMQYLGDEENPYVLFMGRADASRRDVVIHEDTRFVWPNVTFAELRIDSMYWGKSVESYWSDACRAISTLSKIEVSPENPKYHAQGNCLIETATKTLLYGCKTSAIPADGSVTKIGIMAFYGAQGLTDLVIPDSVETICENAFAGCTNLQWLVIGSGVKTIDIDILIRSNASVVIYYMGAAEDWEKIEIRKYNVGPDWGNNAALKNAPRYYYSETEPTELGNYWHYVDGVPTPWKTEE
jgi:hypothetical protein